MRAILEPFGGFSHGSLLFSITGSEVKIPTGGNSKDRRRNRRLVKTQPRKWRFAITESSHE